LGFRPASESPPFRVVVEPGRSGHDEAAPGTLGISGRTQSGL
jgi:hypothetical protein